LVEGLRVELAALALLAAGPDVGGLVVRVLRVGQGFEQAFVTAGAAAVVRRGRTLARGAARVFLARSGRQHFFERDQMQPAIAEVVFILQARVGPGQDIGHAVLPVGERRVVVEIVQRHPETRMAVPLTYGPELMQVGVSPGEGALDGDVQVPEGVVARHLQAAPDQGLDLLELDPDLEEDRKSTRLNSSHVKISYAVFCLKKKNSKSDTITTTRRPTATDAKRRTTGRREKTDNSRQSAVGRVVAPTSTARDRAEAGGLTRQ